METNDCVPRTLQDFKHPFSVLEALNKQRTTSKLCDVILKVCDDQIYAHSNILAAASPYFDSVFSDQNLPRTFSQKNPQLIEIQIDGGADSLYITAVQKVVNFMYTSSLQIEDEEFRQVLEIAKIMQIADIIEFCDLYQQGARTVINPNPNLTQTADAYINGANAANGVKRKRGRPKKTDQVNKNRHETPDVKSQSEKGEEEGDFEELEWDKKETQEEREVKVSKHGRVLKPRKFADDIIRYSVKQEPESDSENVEGTSESCDTKDGTYKEKSGKAQDRIVASKNYMCELCDFEVENLKQFSEHQLEHLKADKKCNICGWACDDSEPSEEKCMEHLNKHRKYAPYLCTFCSQCFISKAKLYQHLPKHSKTKPYVCSVCNAGFRWKHALKTHMIVHGDCKQYLCDLCGYSTAHKFQLKAHYLIHTGNTFRCPHKDCGYQSTKKSNVKAHLLTHTREKPHQCEYCKQSFSLLKNKKRHMLLHRTDRPFRCDHCSFCTTREDKLREHKLKQHHIGDKPKRKLRITDYINNPELVLGNTNTDDNQEVVNEEENTDANNMYETTVLEVTEGMETIEVHVEDAEGETATTQILNIPSSSGENIPIAITQNDDTITYEILHVPVQLLTQETVVE